MSLPVPLDLEPMEAELREELPEGDNWIYEPKWDGFRCLAFRDGDDIELQSKAGKPLARYFPDVVEALLEVKATRFVLDGEIVIPADGVLSFDELLLRIHPAESRVQKLAAANPATFISFDILADEAGRDLTQLPLAERRQSLDLFASKQLGKAKRVQISPHTDDPKTAKKWLAAGREGMDGVMAKRAELPYQAGNRNGMVKVKRMRTAECVVGGFRWSKSGKQIGSLLLGLYGDDGLLHHVGFCSALNATTRKEATKVITPLAGGEGFTGRSPQTKSRWRKEGSGEWERLDPKIVVEVQYDHFSGGRFRHGTKFLRWRPDKPPEACSLNQVEREGASAMKLIEKR